MSFLTLEEQFVQELRELLRFERLLIQRIASSFDTREVLPVKFLQSYISRKHDHVEVLEEILKVMNRRAAQNSPFDRSLEAEIDALMDLCWACSPSTMGALQEIGELLTEHYKHVASHARILGLADAEDLLRSAHAGEANFCLALTKSEFQCAIA